VAMMRSYSNKSNSVQFSKLLTKEPNAELKRLIDVT